MGHLVYGKGEKTHRIPRILRLGNGSTDFSRHKIDFFPRYNFSTPVIRQA